MPIANERLLGVAIIRHEHTYKMDRGSHSDLRRQNKLGEAEPSDVEGFHTSEGRFVGRGLAQAIGIQSGQVDQAGRMLLSSDVSWEAKKSKLKANTIKVPFWFEFKIKHEFEDEQLLATHKIKFIDGPLS